MSAAYPPAGVPMQDMAQLWAGAVLMLSVVLLFLTRISPMIRILSWQALGLAAAAGWQGWARGERAFVVIALVVLAAKAAGLPMLLRRAVGVWPGDGEGETIGGIATAMAGVGLVALAALVVLPATVGLGWGVREALAIALSVLLLGLWIVATRRRVLPRLVGCVCAQNGCFLAVLAAGDASTTLGLALMELVVVAGGLLGVGVFAAGRVRWGWR